MINKKILAFGMCLLLTFSLSGCGEKMYELTEEEEGAIVSYSARSVSKFNNYQNDGLVFVLADSSEDTLGAESEDTSIENVNDSSADDSVVSDENSIDASADDSIEEEKPAAFGGVTTAVQTDDSEYEKKDLTSALNLGSVNASYLGYTISDDYVAGDVFSMTADPGKKFLTVKVRLQNTGSSVANIDMLSIRPGFGLLINGEREAVAMTTVLVDDLGTYQGALNPTDVVDTVIIFSVPEDIESRIGSIGLRVLYDSVKSDIEF